MTCRIMPCIVVFLMARMCVSAPAAPPTSVQIPPDLQQLLNKAQAGRGLTPAEVARLQKGMANLQKQIPSGMAAPGPVGASSAGTSGDGRLKATLLISYHMTISQERHNVKCKGDGDETWTQKVTMTGKVKATGHFGQFKLGGAQGDEAFVVYMDSGTGLGRTKVDGGDNGGHKADHSKRDWGFTQLQGAFWMRSYRSRGDRMTGEPQFIPTGEGNWSATDSCEGKTNSGKSPAPEGMGHILMFLPSFSIEQLSSTQGVDIARQMGKPLPAATLAAITGGGAKAFANWQQARLCDWGISLREFKQGIASHKPFQVVGTANVDKTNPDGTHLEGSITVTVRIGEIPPVELVVRAQNYAKWRPQGGLDEHTAGNTLALTAMLQTKDGKTPPAFIKAHDFKFELTETSSEPGVCLNQPLLNAATSADLKFESSANPGASTTDKTVLISQPSNTANASLSSFDWGGWGKVKVTATLDDDTPLVGYLEGNKSVTEILLPKRKANSKIAEVFNATGADTDDTDTQANNPNKGDGLTVYEEYRGFMARGSHPDLKADIKDLLIENLVGAEVRGGFGLFEGNSGIHVVELKQGELPQDRVVNVNHGHAYGGVQHGLRVIRDSANTNGTAATANHITGADRVAKSPAECVYIGVACDTNAHDTATIAHEMAHACGVKHHGDKGVGIFPGSGGVTRVPYPTVPGSTPATGAGSSFGGPSGPPTPNPCFTRTSSGTPTATSPTATSPASSGPAPGTLIITITANDKNIKIFGSDGVEITQRPYQLMGEVGIEHSKSSGDDSCLMYYDSFYQWAMHQNGNDYTFWAVNPHPPGTTFCTAKTGKGINAPGNKPVNYFGDSENGNCMKQFKVKDW